MLSVTTPLQIKNNPSNNSTAKYHWSFSKASRFSSPKSNCSRSCYDQRSCLSERRASFGTGERKTIFEGKSEVPEGGKYELPSDFEGKNKNKGFSFTNNRENLKFDNYLKTMEITPDPAAYDRDSSLTKKNLYTTLRPKTAYPRNYFLPSQAQCQRQKELPGPGKYEIVDALGKKYYTKSVNSNGVTFKSGNRFRPDKQTPGPSDYTYKTIEPDGIYLLSNMKGSGRRSFLTGQRTLKLNENNKKTPGPGTYRLPSDFGHYENAIRPSTARN